ncbi:MAG TPA: AAA family ATPase [Micromonosporaceae bacterium]|jgi:transitional endoplasmic reticulum ATPase|nr:AAA family ATPase [Micromonosporaceae bacterium]
MADLGSGLRPDIETFECLGCTVALVDVAEILREAAAQRVELLHDAAFPDPVRRVRFTVAHDVRDGGPVFLLDASIRTGAAREPRSASAVLRSHPIAVLVARRAAAGDEWAIRVVDGVGAAAAEVTRRLGLDRRGQGPAGPADAGDVVRSEVREDETAGLRATVTHRELPTGRDGERVITVAATVRQEVMSARHVRAMFTLVLEIVSDLLRDGRDASDDDPLAGRRYVLSRSAAGRPSEPEASARVSLDQVGGLNDVVAQFRQIAVSFRHPQVMARWGARRPQGILLYGPPGTGKTMLARALANEIGADFREIRTPEILDKWLGASERNIKRIFREAREFRNPTVMLFDEFDSIISYAGGGFDAASQAVNAVAGIFKQEMNNLIEENPNVIVVATTNFPRRVDESLIRSGRFDVKLAIPLPDEAGRAEIITKMIRQLIGAHEVAGFRMFADDVDPGDLAGASHGMSGADIKEVLRRVQLAKAMQEARTGAPAAPIGQDDLRRHIAELRQVAA